jgi:hypothetical protein
MPSRGSKILRFYKTTCLNETLKALLKSLKGDVDSKILDDLES